LLYCCLGFFSYTLYIVSIEPPYNHSFNHPLFLTWNQSQIRFSFPLLSAPPTLHFCFFSSTLASFLLSAVAFLAHVLHAGSASAATPMPFSWELLICKLRSSFQSLSILPIVAATCCIPAVLMESCLWLLVPSYRCCIHLLYLFS
jgi:hypothetical protein